jgi:hypothetical protein
MTRKSEFQIHWRNFCSVLNGLMNEQISSMGRLDLSTLNRIYNDRTRNWTSFIQVEGEWLKSINNEEFKQNFLNELKDFSFKLPETKKKDDHKGVTPIVSIAAGVLLFFGLKFLLSLSLLLSLLAGIAAFIAITLGLSKGSKNSEQHYWNEVRALFSEQLTQKGEALANLVEKVE